MVTTVDAARATPPLHPWRPRRHGVGACWYDEARRDGHHGHDGRQDGRDDGDPTTPAIVRPYPAVLRSSRSRRLGQAGEPRWGRTKRGQVTGTNGGMRSGMQPGTLVLSVLQPSGHPSLRYRSHREGATPQRMPV